MFLTIETTSSVRSMTADVVSYLMFSWKYPITEFVRCCLVHGTYQWLALVRGEFRPRQTRQLPRAVDLKGRLLSCQSY